MILIVKRRRDGVFAEHAEQDLRFVRDHLTGGWPDSLSVTEVDEQELISAIVRGQNVLSTVASLVE